MARYPTPGVYLEEHWPEPVRELRTSVPGFLGFVSRSDLGPDPCLETVRRFIRWAQFESWAQSKDSCGDLLSGSYLAHAVRGFYMNGGKLCYVNLVVLDDGPPTPAAVEQGLKAYDPVEDIDLICAPDIMWPYHPGESLSKKDEDDILGMQQEVLLHCEKRGDRLAILDSLPGAVVGQILDQRRRLRANNGALYYPWVRVQDGPVMSDGFVPPCGHVAGVYTRTDESAGFHKAPANEVLEGVVDLEVNLTDAQQGEFNASSVNCLRSFPGRGIRVWGARTLSNNPAWLYINVRRIFTTAVRWIDHNMTDEVFEPNDSRLWASITRDLNAFFIDLHRRGALKGDTPQEAFYVKCDEETNPSEVRERGELVTEIGLAPAIPSEFIVVRLVYSSSGVTIMGPTRPA